MTLLESLIEPLGWTLLHFLWQGAVIGLLHEGTLYACRRRSPQTRYLASLLFMVTLAAAPLLTFVAQWADSTTTPVKVAAVTYSETTSAVASPTPLLELALPYLVAGWLIGVLLLSARFGAGILAVRRLLRQADYQAVCMSMQQQLAALRQQMRIARHVRLALSTQVSSPLVVGWLQPVILLPLSVATGLDHRQLRMVFAHELAHLRRHDHLVNLFQLILETLFFYHPAVHRISRSLRQEREACCDDMAAAISGSRLAYARVLAELEEIRQDRQQAALALGIADHELYARIERLVRAGSEGHEQRWLPVIVLVFAGMFGASHTLDVDAPLLPAWFEKLSERQRIALSIPPAANRSEFLPIREQDTAMTIAPAREETPPAITGPEQTVVTESRRAEERATTAEPGTTGTTSKTEPVVADAASPRTSSDKPASNITATTVRGGRLLHAIEPIYPRRALRAGKEGYVELAFTIAADGSVTNPEVIRAAPRGHFESAALAAISQWKYSPFTENGVAVARKASQVMEFQLGERTSSQSNGSSANECRDQTGTRLCRAVEDLSTELRVIHE